MRPLKAVMGEPRPALVKTLLVLTGAVMAARLVRLVNRYAVDLLYLDQWDIWDGLFHHAGAWSLWRMQWGPQRQGLGEWLIALAAWLSGWNARAEPFVSIGILALCALVALATARSLRGRWSMADCLLPMVLLSVTLLPVMTVVPNVSHGVLPLLLVLLCGYAAQIARPRARALALAGSAALCAQTGFAWYMALIAVPLLLLLLLGAVRARRPVVYLLVGLAVLLASLAIFFHDFKVAPAVACMVPDPHPFRYLQFVGIMFLRAGDLSPAWASALGYVAVAFALGLLFWSGWRTVVTAGEDRLGTTVFLLSAFSLLFAANAAIGRVCLGVQAGGAERYVPYTMAVIVAAYFFVSMGPGLGRLRPAVLVGCFAVLVGKELVLVRSSMAEAGHYTEIKTSFRKCYLGGATLETCSARWPIHPDPKGTHLQEKLDYLRAHRLGLFR